jgi:DNA-directed RNA polymerase subunit N (RpoN/RPB10)
MSRVTEAYGVECHECGKPVEIPVSGPLRCPSCSAVLVIQWEGSRVDYDHEQMPIDCDKSRR